MIVQTNCSEFSLVTKRYLRCFYGILDRMICKMTSVRMGNSISYHFIMQMIPHHCAAIEMARNLLCYTTDLALQEIALGIIKEQTKGIYEMKQMQSSCARVTNTQQQLCQYQGTLFSINQTMFADMKNSCAVNDINLSFINEMIPHHRGAVLMAKNALDFPICPCLVPVLNTIITSQQQGICEMEALLREESLENHCLV